MKYNPNSNLWDFHDNLIALKFIVILVFLIILDMRDGRRRVYWVNKWTISSIFNPYLTWSFNISFSIPFLTMHCQLFTKNLSAPKSISSCLLSFIIFNIFLLEFPHFAYFFSHSISLFLPEITTWAETKNPTLNWPHHPGAPPFLSFYKGLCFSLIPLRTCGVSPVLI